MPPTTRPGRGSAKHLALTGKEKSVSLDPRIGMLTSGKFYCFPKGAGQPEFEGTLDEVEAALGIRREPPVLAVVPKSASSNRLWNVRLTFQYPAWDEVNGIEYPGIPAHSKTAANAIARRRASNDGHLCGGKGRATFTAREQQ